MKITFLPLNCPGWADLDCSQIFISLRYGPQIMLDSIRHELAHLFCGNELHDLNWHDIYEFMGGHAPKFIYSRNVGNVALVQNVGNVTGIQNILLDYWHLQAYRKFAQRILGTEGQWEVKGNNRIRLFPTPRGSFPVVIEYFPTVSQFRTPWAKEITKRAMVAEAKIILGNARSKFGGIPSPDGGTLNLNGDAMRTEGQTEKDKAVQDAILHGEPLPILMW